uniref:Uncharacterized protein n=1 Tax=Anguilla anguilla TaxID=7936 RepID=A0A0E9PXX6_ANGAN
MLKNLCKNIPSCLVLSQQYFKDLIIICYINRQPHNHLNSNPLG